MKERLLYWIPRVAGIAVFLFMVLFSLDCFEGDTSLKERLICFVMHNIPALVVLMLVLIAWFNELPGGILIILTGIIGMIGFRGFSGNPGVLIIMVPIVLVGAMFIWHSKLKSNLKTMNAIKTPTHRNL